MLPKPPLPFSSPFLEKLYQEGIFSYLDLVLPSRLLQETLSEDLVALLAALLAFSRQGSLCIEIKENKVLPDVSLLWEEPSEDSIELEKRICRGFSNSRLPFPVWKNRLYLPRNWDFETRILAEVQRLKDAAPTFPFAETKLEQLEKGGLLLPSQAKALQACSSSAITFLSGGPGTGKTYTAKYLLQLALPNCRIAISAPTGKAVSHLKEKIGRSDITAATLHSLLGMQKQAPFQKKTLPYDLFVIDEASMIDVRLMTYLLESVPQGARVIFLGDPDQLPPVEAGSVFADLIAAYPEHNAHLEAAIRFEKKELVCLAHAIRDSDSGQIQQLLQEGKEIKHLTYSQEELLLYAASHFFSSSCTDPEEILKRGFSFRMLSCLRAGPMGADKLNQQLLDLLFQRLSPGDQWVCPILLTENDHVKGLYNGMNGVILSRYSGKKNLFHPTDKVYLEKARGEIIELSYQSMPRFEIGFCLSVHKSQGSEYEHVLLVVPPGSEKFGREVLYTAATRAKKKLEIFGELKILADTAKRSSQRMSSIRLRSATL